MTAAPCDRIKRTKSSLLSLNNYAEVCGVCNGPVGCVPGETAKMCIRIPRK